MQIAYSFRDFWTDSDTGLSAVVEGIYFRLLISKIDMYPGSRHGVKCV